MNANLIDNLKDKKIVQPIGAISWIKHFTLRIVKVFSFDASPIFKSKEWPHL